MTKSISTEIGLKDLYTKKTHVGIVKKVTSKDVIIENEDNEEIILISSIDIMSKREVYEWKKNNLELERFSLTVQLSSRCDAKYLIKIFSQVEFITDVELIGPEQVKRIDDKFHIRIYDIPHER